jgi:hypothetical protein
MLGREPRLPHRTTRWLIISLMLINGIQLVLLQLAINSSALYHVSETWTYVAISFAALLLSTGLIVYAFARSRGKGHDAGIGIRESKAGSPGTVSSDDPGNRD